MVLIAFALHQFDGLINGGLRCENRRKRMITAILEGDIPLDDADSHRTFTRLWRPSATLTQDKEYWLAKQLIKLGRIEIVLEGLNKTLLE